VITSNAAAQFNLQRAKQKRCVTDPKVSMKRLRRTYSAVMMLRTSGVLAKPPQKKMRLMPWQLLMSWTHCTRSSMRQLNSDRAKSSRLNLPIISTRDSATIAGTVWKRTRKDQYLKHLSIFRTFKTKAEKFLGIHEHYTTARMSTHESTQKRHLIFVYNNNFIMLDDLSFVYIYFSVRASLSAHTGIRVS